MADVVRHKMQFRSRALLSLLCFLLLIVGESMFAHGHFIASGRGTLVAVVPFGEGVVVAADSRETIAGLHCDQRSKLRIPDATDNLVVTVTGQSRWYDLSGLVGGGRSISVEELCPFIST